MILIQPPIRGNDVQGSGAYGASRGKRKHKGVDFACYPESSVYAWSAGIVQRIGYPYADPKKRYLRLVQIEDDRGSIQRYLYVEPMVKKGDRIKPGDLIGISQKLPYKGITQHVHFDVKMVKQGQSRRTYVNPVKYIEGEI